MNNTETTQLTELVRKIGSTMHEYCEALPEEEKWNIPYKLKGRSSDAIAWVGEASGSTDPRDVKWALGKAKASLSATKDVFRHACDIGLMKMNPEVMVWLDQAMELADGLIKEATVKIPEWFQEMESPQKDVKK